MAPSPSTISVTEKHHGKSVQLKVGDRLAVRLDAQPGTGHSWEVQQVSASLLAAIGEPKFEDAAKGMPGGVQPWVSQFQALQPGTTELVCHYLQPWERANPPAKTYHITVVISA